MYPVYLGISSPEIYFIVFLLCILTVAPLTVRHIFEGNHNWGVLDVMAAMHDLANDIVAGNLDNPALRMCEICVEARVDVTLCGLGCGCELSGSV